MDSHHLPKIPMNRNVLSVHNGSQNDSHDYVIFMGKSHGGMRFQYASLDPNNNMLSPKLNTIVWARLIDLVDFATCVFKNCLYVIGGREKSSGKLCRDVNKYDPVLGRWKICEEMKKPRAEHAAVAIWGKIFVFGGATASSEVTASCESYEPLMDDWREEEPLPEPRKGHACVATEDKVYVTGGTSSTEVANDNAWILTRHVPDARKPESIHYEWSDMPDPRQTGLGYRLTRHTATVCKNKLYIMGGVCNGQTTDGVKFIRKHVPLINIESEYSITTTITESTSNSTSNGLGHASPASETPEIKWHIGAIPVIEAYKMNLALPDFSIEPDVEEATHKERLEQEKLRQKQQKLKERRRRRQKTDEEYRREKEEEERRLREEEEQRKAREAIRNEMRNRTFWKTDLPQMPQARCSFGTFVVGNKIYLIGGHTLEDDSRVPLKSVGYYHTRKKEWVHAFDFPDAGDFSDIDCCALTVPTTNRDFKPMTYAGCKWVMW